jgi:hypothetical protein
VQYLNIAVWTSRILLKIWSCTFGCLVQSEQNEYCYNWINLDKHIHGWWAPVARFCQEPNMCNIAPLCKVMCNEKVVMLPICIQVVIGLDLVWDINCPDWVFYSYSQVNVTIVPEIRPNTASFHILSKSYYSLIFKECILLCLLSFITHHNTTIIKISFTSLV